MKCYFIRRTFVRICSIRRQKSRPAVDTSPEISWRNLAWRFSRNKYIHTGARARPCVRAPTRRNYRATIILPFHAFCLGRHHHDVESRYSNFHSLPSPFDASYMEPFLSLSLHSSSISLVVYFLLWLPILIISVRVVSISVCKMQDEDYIFCMKRAHVKFLSSRANGAIRVGNNT